MKILLVGNRAIQHALESRLRNEGVDVHVYPGQRFSGYICVNEREAAENRYDLIVIGSPRYVEDPVVKLQIARGARVFGPDYRSVELESSKYAFKRFSKTYGIPTPPSRVFTDYAAAMDYIKSVSPPFVIKADGPARGCGVSISESIEEAVDDLDRKLGDKNSIYYSDRILIEEYVPGFEVAINILVSPSGYILLPPTRPHKRRNDGDVGQIVAGMGSFAPIDLNPAFYDELHLHVLLPTFRGMRDEGRMFSGCLFVNLMINENGITVLEFNCRMGDPATLTSLMLINSSISSLLLATVQDELANVRLELNDGVALAVTLVDQTYPDGVTSNKRVKIAEQDLLTGNNNSGLAIAGVEVDGQEVGRFIVTNGVIGCAVSRGPDFSRAKEAVYALATKHPDLHFRTDIGSRVTPPKRYHQQSRERGFIHYLFRSM